MICFLTLLVREHMLCRDESDGGKKQHEFYTDKDFIVTYFSSRLMWQKWLADRERVCSGSEQSMSEYKCSESVEHWTMRGIVNWWGAEVGGVPDWPQKVWKVQHNMGSCAWIYNGVQLEYRLQSSDTWSAAAWPPRLDCVIAQQYSSANFPLRFNSQKEKFGACLRNVIILIFSFFLKLPKAKIP